MIHVLATITLAPDMREKWLEQFHRIMPLVQAEAGCIEYAPAIDVLSGLGMQSPVRDDQAVIIEKWTSLEHLKAHIVAPHMLEYRERIQGLVVGVTLRILESA